MDYSGTVNNDKKCEWIPDNLMQFENLVLFSYFLPYFKVIILNVLI